MDSDNVTKYQILIQSLDNLSKPYSEQVKSYPEYVDVFDEVITDFDNALRLLPSIMEAHLIPYDAVMLVLRCQTSIDTNLCMDERKTDESFAKDDSWNQIRKDANSALLLIKE